jgi:hypothetical protein
VCLSSLAMWFNCVRGLDDAGTGLTVAQLERRGADVDEPRRDAPLGVGHDRRGRSGQARRAEAEAHAGDAAGAGEAAGGGEKELALVSLLSPLSLKCSLPPTQPPGWGEHPSLRGAHLRFRA